jgi:ubiquinone/menaquinone biosynthesis C-methylase UbiE
LQQLEKGATRDEILDALESPGPADIPEFVRKTQAWLQNEACPIPDYITTALSCFDCDLPRQSLSDLALDTFMTIWNGQLAQHTGPTIPVLEVACGSANDYRFFDRCGLTPLLRYTGIDIATKNIANARRRYPKVDFRVQSILATHFPDASFDCVFCHDLIEHLSPEAMGRACAEMLRIARSEVILHFFNAKWSGTHEIVPIRRYYRNRVSMEKVMAFFEHQGADVTCLEMAQWLREKLGATGYHNPNTFSLIVDKQVEPAE